VTFAQKELGDVLLAWENEAYLVLAEFGADNFDIVYPPSSILAEPPVAIVDKNVEAHGTADLAKDLRCAALTARNESTGAAAVKEPLPDPAVNGAVKDGR
jgi:ABC-type sulfate transport system substrate-binding protein